MKTWWGIFLVPVLLALTACRNEATVGTPANPVMFNLHPGSEPESAAALGRFLEKDTGLAFRMVVPDAEVRTIEALGKSKADAALMTTFAYLLAHQEFGAEAGLVALRGADERAYKGEIIARQDSGISSIKDVAGKSFGFTDPYSTSGFVLPAKLLVDEGVKTARHEFLGAHAAVVEAVYSRRIDAGAAYYNPPDQSGAPKDARLELSGKYADIFEKVRIVALTAEIPNEPVVFRKGLRKDLREKTAAAIMKFSSSAEGRSAFAGIAHITGFAPATDLNYIGVLKMVTGIGKSVEDMVPGGWIIHIRNKSPETY